MAFKSFKDQDGRICFLREESIDSIELLSPPKTAVVLPGSSSAVPAPMIGLCTVTIHGIAHVVQFQTTIPDTFPDLDLPDGTTPAKTTPAPTHTSSGGKR